MKAYKTNMVTVNHPSTSNASQMPHISAS